MPSITSAAILGLLLGLRHATDADHVVAVTAIVSGERSLTRAARIGVLWGVGHSITLLAVGGIIVAFRLVIPPRIGLGLEFGVALMLILLGFSNLRNSVSPAEAHEHQSAFRGLRPFFVGIVHGLAGSAAVALLVLATIRDTAWALAYLAVFGVGTIVGMMLVTVLLAAPALYATRRVTQLQRGLRLAAGTLSVVFGLLLAREIVSTNGLFGPNPIWTPK